MVHHRIHRLHARLCTPTGIRDWLAILLARTRDIHRRVHLCDDWGVYLFHNLEMAKPGTLVAECVLLARECNMIMY